VLPTLDLAQNRQDLIHQGGGRGRSRKRYSWGMGGNHAFTLQRLDTVDDSATVESFVFESSLISSLVPSFQLDNSRVALNVWMVSTDLQGVSLSSWVIKRAAKLVACSAQDQSRYVLCWSTPLINIVLLDKSNMVLIY